MVQQAVHALLSNILIVRCIVNPHGKRSRLRLALTNRIRRNTPRAGLARREVDTEVALDFVILQIVANDVDHFFIGDLGAEVRLVIVVGEAVRKFRLDHVEDMLSL